MKLRILFALLVTAFVANAEETRLLRFPNASQTHITFSYGGDIYTVPLSGGLARRVTSSEGVELHPRFSPDGKYIAFTGEYDGNREIYTIPSFGGEPARVTYSMDIPGLPERMGPDKIIMQWTNNKEILFRSRSESWQAWTGKLFTTSIEGGLPKQVPLPVAGHATFNNDGSKIAYNRVFREFRTWKRYRGGQADDIWIYDFNSKELTNITKNPAQDIIPMWVGDKVYFLSDRDKVMNLFVYDTKTDETKKLTDFKEYDVKYPSMGGQYIAFENGGYVYILDTKTDLNTKVSIEVQEDFPANRTKITRVKDKIGSFGVSNDGKRGLFSARGDIFTVPAEKGYIRNLTKSPGSHERNPIWSPDGKYIAYVSDASGEDEIYLSNADGSEINQLTKDAQSYRYEMLWSPDSKKILASDKSLRLFYIDIDTKKTTVVAKSKMWELRDFSWSPDSKWIAFTDQMHSGISIINLYSLDSKKITQATSELFESQNPVFTPGGQYLLFVSGRNFDPSVSDVEWNFSIKDQSRIYALALTKDAENLFAYNGDDKPTKAETEDKSNDDKKGKDEKKAVEVKIDLDGLEDRIMDFDIPRGYYNNLFPSKDHKLYYVRSSSSQGPKTYIYDIKTRKESEVGDFSAYDISGDGEKIIISKDGNYYITKLAPKIELKEGKLDLEEMKVTLDKKAEWNQVYNEGWRQMKYFFYDPNMHGYDWNKIHDRYQELVPFVQHRFDLTYIMGEMIGELNIGHAYSGGGDSPKVPAVGIGLLGAEFEYDEKSGFYKIKNIFPGRNWEEKTRSPLTEVGVNVKVGDYLLEIDGIKLNRKITPYVALVDKVSKYVKLKTNSKASETGAIETNIKTIAGEERLRYFDWVETNRRYVEEKSGGKIGYIHVPDMGVGNGLIEFIKYFYPQIRKEGLIIDDRYNGGGNVSSMIIERLKREIGVVKNFRNQEMVTTTPDAVMTGPMVCLINELSASDGDLFPYQFKVNKLGKVIGKRSWGGVVGIRGSLPFLDGGYMNKPEFVNFSHESKWVLEGEGMTPDIEVDNHPAKVLAGIDEQLDKAIEVVTEEMKTNSKRKIPILPKYPDKR